MNKLWLHRGSKVTFVLTREVQEEKTLERVLNNLSEDLLGVLDCETVKEQETGIRFSFEFIRGMKEQTYQRLVEEEQIRFAASDRFGLIFGIYDFCEKILGVNPFRKFSDLPYQKKDGVSVEEIACSDPPVYRFRGWFFNDEDYVTGWRKPAGKRPVDYLFYSNIMNHDTVEELTDVILRNKLNLMIPSSFLDIDMPEDEENIRRITARGLYVSQHHIEPLGVSRFAFEAYFQRKGIIQEGSYTKYPEAYDEIWRHYVTKWAKYKNVIWQLGLRGKVDRPIWADDAEIGSREYAGKVISDAIAHQYRIVREITGVEQPLATVTLWEEGAGLYLDGYLTIPEGVTVVFTNWPRTQRMKADFYSIPREEGRTYGVYHHTGSFSAGPHAVQGQKLDLMKQLFATTVGKGDTQFVISNVQCLREVVFGAYAMAKFAFDGPECIEEDIVRDWCASLLPEKTNELADMYRLFYDTFPVNVWDEASKGGTAFWFDGYVRMAGLLAMDRYRKNIWGLSFTPEMTRAYVEEMKDSRQRWEETIKDLEEFLQKLPEGKAKSFLTDNLWVQAKIISNLSGWSYLVNQAIDTDRKGSPALAAAQAAQAAEVLEGMRAVLSVAEHDKFTGWYTLEDKFDYPALIKLTKELEAFLRTPVEQREYLKDTTDTRADYILNYKYRLG